MSRPVGIQQVPPLQVPTGIRLALGPTSDPTLRWQVRSAVGSSTGTFTTYPDLAGALGPGQYPTFTDVLPLDGQTRVYQHRAVRNDGTVVGAWSPSLKAKPVVLPEGQTIQTPVTGHKVGSHLSLSTGIKVQYGSGNVQSSGRRITVFPQSLFVSISSTVSGYTRSAQGALSPSTVGGSSSAYQWQGGLVLPASAKLVKLAMTYSRSVGARMAWKFNTVVGIAITSTFWSVTSPSSAINVLSSSSFGPISSTAYDYILGSLVLKTNGNIPRFFNVKATYTIPSYDKTV